MRVADPLTWRGRADRLPLALANAHSRRSVGDPFTLRLRATRRLCESRVVALLEGAGFDVTSLTEGGEEWIDVAATRARTLADVVGPGMRLLCVGLNPSQYAADHGVAFARPGNRFWPAALAAGIVARDRDAYAAWRDHGVGFTDLVKRATVKASELSTAELEAGVARVRALVEWLQPGAVCLLGVTGARVAFGPDARAGWQPEPFGGRPIYVMPNPSGANAHARLPALVDHLRTAYAGH